MWTAGCARGRPTVCSSRSTRSRRPTGPGAARSCFFRARAPGHRDDRSEATGIHQPGVTRPIGVHPPPHRSSVVPQPRRLRAYVASLAGQSLSARCHLRWHRHQFRDLLRGCGEGRAVPVRRGQHRDPGRVEGSRRLRLPRLPAEHRPRPAIRLPDPRPPRTRQGAAMQSVQASSGPIRQGGRRRDRLGPVGLRLQLRRPRQHEHRGFRVPGDEVGGHQPVLRLER